MLFNLFGYKLVIHYLHNENAAQLAVQIDKNKYDETALISIKTPISLPYYTNTEIYERAEGVIAIEGVYYNYVKRRVFNDSLELLCLPNPTKAKLDKAESDITKSVSEGGPLDKGSKKLEVRHIMPEFCEHQLLMTSISRLFEVSFNFPSFTYFIPNRALPVFTPPPNGMQGLV